MTTQSNNNHNHHHGNSHLAISCVSPKIGERLPDYIVDLLNDEEAFVVEQHLAECRLCKERYLLMLRVRSEAASHKEVTVPEDDAELSNDTFDGLEANQPRNASNG